MMHEDEPDRADVINAFLTKGDFDAAENYANSIEDDWQRAESLGAIARWCSSRGDLSRARGIWESAIAAACEGQESESGQDRWDSSSVLSEIAENIAVAGDADLARSVAKSVKVDHMRDRASAAVERILIGGQGTFKY